MRIFVIGDFRTGTGPANVTKEYLLRLPKNTGYLIGRGKLVRAIEIILKMPFYDVVLFSGHSKQNLLGLKWARRLKKKSAFLMHGCVEHENAINECVNQDMIYVERETLRLCDRIYAVSTKFAGWLRTFYPEYSDKIDVCINGVDDANYAVNGVTNKAVKFADETNEAVKKDKNSYLIFSVGGGMPRKKIKHVCKAVELLNREEGKDKYKLIVVGDKGKDDEAINKYPFVINYGLVDSNCVRSIYRNADLFVQNSCFETFGLAPMEALVNGCSVLLSKEIGALELFNGLRNCDLIDNWFDETEIACKIKYLVSNKNAGRLLSAFNKESSSWEMRTRELEIKLNALAQEEK